MRMSGRTMHNDTDASSALGAKVRSGDTEGVNGLSFCLREAARRGVDRRKHDQAVWRDATARTRQPHCSSEGKGRSVRTATSRCQIAPLNPVTSIVRVRRFVMAHELRIDLIIKMSQAIDDMLLSWDGPRPTLNEAIAAQIQSLARAISATTDPGPSLATVKKDLDSVVADILRIRRDKRN